LRRRLSAPRTGTASVTQSKSGRAKVFILIRLFSLRHVKAIPFDLAPPLAIDAQRLIEIGVGTYAHFN
jgi:hypothetical protein